MKHNILVSYTIKLSLVPMHTLILQICWLDPGKRWFPSLFFHPALLISQNTNTAAPTPHLMHRMVSIGVDHMRSSA